MSPDAVSQLLERLANSGAEDSAPQCASLDTYWNVLTSLSMPSRFGRNTTSLSSMSPVVALMATD
jgi:hypothetical protein